MSTLRLGVNIDHIATVRQARYAGLYGTHNCEPDLVTAAAVVEAAGATGITIHLRADRRHIQDADVYALRKSITTKMNLELGNTPEIVAIALGIKPEDVCLVPENREEVTTEGGLDVIGHYETLAPTVEKLRAAGTRVSLFIEPDFAQIDTSVRLGAEAVELHTGAFANAQGSEQLAQLERIREAAGYAHRKGLQVNAGHGLNYTNTHLIRPVPHLEELNIGHSIVSRSLFVGLDRAVREMLALMEGRPL